MFTIKNTGPSLTIDQVTQYFMGKVGGEGADCPVADLDDIYVRQNEKMKITVPCSILNNYVGETVDMKITIISAAKDQNGIRQVIGGRIFGVVPVPTLVEPVSVPWQLQ